METVILYPHLVEQLDAYSNYNCYVDGYFQKHKYLEPIREYLIQDFVPATNISNQSKELIKELRSVNSVCINIRRADFIHNSKNAEFHGFYGLNYIEKAIDLLEADVKDPHFYIFSDDIQWCRDNISLDSPTKIIDHNYKGEKFVEYMTIMKNCKHFIIPNSSFAWWAAWLNNDNDKVVLIPERWFQAAHVNTNDMSPPNWIRLNLPTE